jgi:pimeloyl-ACP methyl ester carboxylesterase
MPGSVDRPRTLVARDGARIGYRTWRPGGPRPVLVLLHGLASNLTRWSEFVATTALRDSWDLLRLDLRGHGTSAHRGRIGMGQWCADLAAVLAAEGYPRAVVAGHCLGANIALEFAVRHPERTRGLVVIEPMLRDALTGAMRRLAAARALGRPALWLVRTLNALGVFRRRLAPLDLLALDRQARAAIAAGQTPEGAFRAYASPLADLRTTPCGAYLEGLMAVTGRPPRLAAIVAPALALLAAGSPFSDARRTRDLLRALPDLAVVTLPARHWIPTEAPEAMRRTIEHWCAGIGVHESARGRRAGDA